MKQIKLATILSNTAFRGAAGGTNILMSAYYFDLNRWGFATFFAVLGIVVIVTAYRDASAFSNAQRRRKHHTR